MSRPTPRSTLFPYTTLFRSDQERQGHAHPFPAQHLHRHDNRNEGILKLSNATALPGAVDSTVGAGESALTLNGDRKSTRLNSSHTVISYAVFCLKKKNRTKT